MNEHLSPVRAAVYARVSTDMQAEEEIPLSGQIEECKRFCEAREWTVTKVYQDEGVSGRHDRRPGFQEMISASREKPRPFDRIVTWRSM